MALTRDEAVEFLKQYNALEAGREFVCRHGHFGCSIKNYGPCLDEVLSRFPELQDADL